jgi:putative copper export protein
MTMRTIGIVTFLLSLIALVFIATTGDGPIHMAIAGCAALVFAIIAIVEENKLRSDGASETLISAINARNMGVVWIWGAAGLLFTYLFVLSWEEWLTFLLVFAVVGALCFLLSHTLHRDAASQSDDQTVTKIARYLAIAQLIGMVITMVGLIIDGKMLRYVNPRQGWEDWAANHIFFFGAMALAIISANALYRSRQTATAE